MSLKENYVDDILNTSKNTKRKYNMITNADGTVSFEDVTEYSQNGDNFGSADVNAITKAINELKSGGSVTIRYNEETDSIQIYLDGQWVDWKEAGMDEPQPLIPVMTADSMEFGTASASSSFSGSPAYMAFDGNDATFWRNNTAATSGIWLKYQSERKNIIKRIELKIQCEVGNSTRTLKLFYNSNSSWTELTNATATWTGDIIYDYSFDCPDNFETDGIMIEFTSSVQDRFRVMTMQLYGRELQ